MTQGVRIYGLALVAGLVAELALAVGIYNGAPSGLGILLFAEAVALGWLFGARAGMVGAAVPLPLIYAVDLIRRESAGGPSEDVTSAVIAIVFVAVLLAFAAGMAGALRTRYLGAR